MLPRRITQYFTSIASFNYKPQLSKSLSTNTNSQNSTKTKSLIFQVCII